MAEILVWWLGWGLVILGVSAALSRMPFERSRPAARPLRTATRPSRLDPVIATTATPLIMQAAMSVADTRPSAP